MAGFGGPFTAIPLPYSSQLRVEDGCGASSACRLFTMFRATLLSDSRPDAPASFRLYLLSLLSLLFYTPRVRQSIQTSLPVLTEQVLCDNDSLWPHSQYSARGPRLAATWYEQGKNGGKWRFFGGQKRHFSVLGAGPSQHKPLIWPLLCRPTFLAAQTKKNGGRHLLARSFFDVTRRGGRHTALGSCWRPNACAFALSFRPLNRGGFVRPDFAGDGGFVRHVFASDGGFVRRVFYFRPSRRWVRLSRFRFSTPSLVGSFVTFWRSVNHRESPRQMALCGAFWRFLRRLRHRSPISEITYDWRLRSCVPSPKTRTNVSKIGGPMRVQSLLTFRDQCARARYIAKIRENRASSENCEIPRNMRYRETRMQLVSATPAGRTVRHDRSAALGARIDRQTCGHRSARESGSENFPSKESTKMPKIARSRRVQSSRPACILRALRPYNAKIRSKRDSRNSPSAVVNRLPVHGAAMIGGPSDTIEEIVARTQEAMSRDPRLRGRLWPDATGTGSRTCSVHRCLRCLRCDAIPRRHLCRRCAT